MAHDQTVGLAPLFHVPQIKSVNSPRLVASTSAETRALPLFTRVELVTLTVPPPANCFKRDEGSRDVDTQTFAWRSSGQRPGVFVI